MKLSKISKRLLQMECHHLTLLRRLLLSTRSRNPKHHLLPASCFHQHQKFCSAVASSDLTEFSPQCVREGADQYFRVIPGFFSLDEEQNILKEVTRGFRRKKYQYDHWDGAIEGYRETERSQWSDDTQPVIERLRDHTTSAVAGKELETLDDIHVLDLAADGEIKPHIDSVKFCGEVIAGVSLLSASIMKLQSQDNPEKWITALLPRHSLYIMSGEVRFQYTHAIPREDFVFRGRKVVRDRRLSLICRTSPTLS